MVLNPDFPQTKRGDVLQLARVHDERLFSDRAGVVWNFPAAEKGVVTVDARILGAGFRMTLSDHWMNPCDAYNPSRQPVSVCLTQKELPCRTPIVPLEDWHRVSIAWDVKEGTFALSADGRVLRAGCLSSVPKAGLSYLHLQTLAEDADPLGTHFREFAMEGR